MIITLDLVSVYFIILPVLAHIKIYLVSLRGEHNLASLGTFKLFIVILCFNRHLFKFWTLLKDTGFKYLNILCIQIVNINTLQGWCLKLYRIKYWYSQTNKWESKHYHQVTQYNDWSGLLNQIVLNNKTRLLHSKWHHLYVLQTAKLVWYLSQILKVWSSIIGEAWHSSCATTIVLSISAGAMQTASHISCRSYFYTILLDELDLSSLCSP